MNDDSIAQLIKATPSFQVRETSPQVQVPDFEQITRQANDPQTRRPIKVEVNSVPRGGAGGGGAGSGFPVTLALSVNGQPGYYVSVAQVGPTFL